MTTRTNANISVLVPTNPFVHGKLSEVQHCLAALDVNKLMEWWPGRPHSPHRDPSKVSSIQRSLDWVRVAKIAAYLLQQEIVNANEKLDRYFSPIYEPRKNDPGREWPPRVPSVIGYEPSEYPAFSNVLLHVNGAKLEDVPGGDPRAKRLVFHEASKSLNFSVIDGQHRINGAFLAVMLLRETNPKASWDIPAEIFLDLDKAGEPPRHQAQIFIDVNFYQKKVDRSLVADLFPTARGDRTALDDKERAQDLGRMLMLEVGPLVGMIQIPGIRFGVKGVVTLATLNSAIEDVLPVLRSGGLQSLEEQSQFIAQCLEGWLVATGRRESPGESGGLSPENVVYQGRILVAVVSLVPGCVCTLKSKKITLLSKKASAHLAIWFAAISKRAGLIHGGQFIDKTKFKELGFLGSGGIARFRDLLWASINATKSVAKLSSERLSILAEKARRDAASAFGP